MRFVSIFTVFSLALLLSACSSVESAYDSVAEGVGNAYDSTFNRYNYRSNLKTRRARDWESMQSRYDEPPKVAKQENWKNYKIGGPYQISGRWYYPKEEPNYDQVGIASWYGAQFHNKRTANGEVFNKNHVTAAHNTLPMPSIVRVTNLENGKSIVVRVNDRGPFAKNRVIDLSEKAAELLGFKDQGTAKVRVQFDRKLTRALFFDPWDADAPMEPQLVYDKHQTSPYQNNTTEMARSQFYREHYVQAGAYSSWDNARSVAKELKKIGKVHIRESHYRGTKVYKVQVGPFNDQQKAGTVLDQVAMLGFTDAVVMGE